MPKALYSHKDYKLVAAGLKRIYQSIKEEVALHELELFGQMSTHKLVEADRRIGDQFTLRFFWDIVVTFL